jgi:hypothetical protein
MEQGEEHSKVNLRKRAVKSAGTGEKVLGELEV